MTTLEKSEQELMPMSLSLSLFDRVERLWLRFNRQRARGVLEYHEWEQKEQKRLVGEARARYQFWIDQERVRGIPNYNDQDITWKVELYLYSGIIALASLWFLVYILVML